MSSRLIGDRLPDRVDIIGSEMKQEVKIQISDTQVFDQRLFHTPARDDRG